MSVVRRLRAARMTGASRWIVPALVAIAARGAIAQERTAAQCDSVIAAAKSGMASTGLFLAVRRIDGIDLDSAHANRVILNVGSAFVAPRPFALNVFGGPPLMRALRPVGRDSAVLRSPTLTGIYRVIVRRADSATAAPSVVRRALMDSFDSAAVESIRSALMIRDVFLGEDEGDSARFDIVFTTDSIAGARRLAAAAFPRIPVVDATPIAGSPAPVYPAIADDSVDTQVIVRFVVQSDGTPAPGTIEVLRAPSLPFLKAAVEALERQRFHPATVRGCPVAQQIVYPLVFVANTPG